MPSPIIIDEENLSNAWLRAFRTVVECRAEVGPPMWVTITGLSNDDVSENTAIRIRLDSYLHDTLPRRTSRSIEKTAFTIFPYEWWNKEASRNDLYEKYLRAWPRLRKLYRYGQGSYFQRMICFPVPEQTVTKNQLDHIIQFRFRPNHGYRNRYQISLFNPLLDHTNATRGDFPCLQHVVFSWDTNSGMDVIALYASQNLYHKSYGNYIGLAHLGQFMAHEMRLTLRSVQCITTRPSHCGISKTAARHLIEMIDQEQ